MELAVLVAALDSRTAEDFVVTVTHSLLAAAAAAAVAALALAAIVAALVQLAVDYRHNTFQERSPVVLIVPLGWQAAAAMKRGRRESRPAFASFVAAAEAEVERSLLAFALAAAVVLVAED